MRKAIRKRRTQQTNNRRLIEPEQIIRRLSVEGKLAAIGQKAVEDSFRLGLPVTQLEGNNIVQIFPDGRKVILKTLAKAI